MMTINYRSRLTNRGDNVFPSRRDDHVLATITDLSGAMMGMNSQLAGGPNEFPPWGDDRQVTVAAFISKSRAAAPIPLRSDHCCGMGKSVAHAGDVWRISYSIRNLASARIRSKFAIRRTLRDKTNVHRKPNVYRGEP